ncbi:MAG: hypothetical protein IPL46_07570 [Saprospiraceae bacterium]|nr:hypothetical protein [Saprospiraceae bacterium]
MIKHFLAPSMLLFLIACKPAIKAPDVSHIEVDPALIRFEQEMFSDSNNIDLILNNLQNKYPEFTDVFLHRIIADPQYGNDVILSASHFVSDSFIRGLYTDCQTLYLDFSKQEQQIKDALRYFKHYFPEKPIPDIYTCITGFDYGSFTVGDDILSISLDFYLGDNYPSYHPDIFPAFIVRTMTEDYLVSKSIQALVANYVGETTGARLLDYMIRNGIELYIKRKLLPRSTDEIIFEYSSDQLVWLEDNESEIWAHLIQEDLLMSVDYRSFQKIITPSPNVPNMPPDAPGRLGNWIGTRIVTQFMERNPDLSLDELIAMNDAQKILAESKYKPRQ